MLSPLMEVEYGQEASQDKGVHHFVLPEFDIARFIRLRSFERKQGCVWKRRNQKEKVQKEDSQKEEVWKISSGISSVQGNFWAKDYDGSLKESQ